MKKLLLLIVLFGSFVHSSLAQNVVKQANRFIELLTEEQKISTLFPFDNNERYNFHFVPIKRKGVTFNEMSPQQIEVGSEPEPLDNFNNSNNWLNVVG